MGPRGSCESSQVKPGPGTGRRPPLLQRSGRAAATVECMDPRSSHAARGRLGVRPGPGDAADPKRYEWKYFSSTMREAPIHDARVTQRDRTHFFLVRRYGKVFLIFFTVFAIQGILSVGRLSTAVNKSHASTRR